MPGGVQPKTLNPWILPDELLFIAEKMEAHCHAPKDMVIEHQGEYELAIATHRLHVHRWYPMRNIALRGHVSLRRLQTIVNKYRIICS